MLYYFFVMRKTYKTKVNDSYFDVIDTEKKAYILGFLIADGCIVYETKPSGHISKRIRFHNTVDDSEAIKCIRDEICPNRELKPIHCISNKRKKDQYQLKWVSNYMVEVLENKYGIKQRKTYDSSFSFPMQYLPTELFRHFLRGFFDGDGHVDYNGIQFVFTSENFMNQIISWFKNFNYKVYKIKGKTVDYSKVVIFLDSKGKECIRHFLYDSASIYLSRKKRIFDTEITYSSRNSIISIVEHRAEKI